MSLRDGAEDETTGFEPAEVSVASAVCGRTGQPLVLLTLEFTGGRRYEYGFSVRTAEDLAQALLAAALDLRRSEIQ